MNITEIINESVHDPQIKKDLIAKGYKYIAKGVDQMVFLNPQGTITKIFGTSRGSIPNMRLPASGPELPLTNAQQTLMDFFHYIQKNKNNPFLPNILKVEPFTYKGRVYLNIEMERLFPFKGKHDWNKFLAKIATWVEQDSTLELFLDQFRPKKATKADKEVFNLSPKVPYYKHAEKAYKDRQKEHDSMHELFIHLGMDGLKLLWKTIKDLNTIANRGVYNLDLHAGNFMLSGDGDVVITDPFFIGWGS